MMSLNLDLKRENNRLMMKSNTQILPSLNSEKYISNRKKGKEEQEAELAGSFRFRNADLKDLADIIIPMKN